MAWTKRQYIEKAFAKIGLASYTFDMEPEEWQAALGELDAIMALWNDRGIQLGWPLTNDPTSSDLDADTGTADRANVAIYLNLAINIAGNYGKMPAPLTIAQASSAYKTLLTDYNLPPKMKRRLLTSGAGHKDYGNDGSYNTFLPEEDDNIIDEPATEIGFT